MAAVKSVKTLKLFGEFFFFLTASIATYPRLLASSDDS